MTRKQEQRLAKARKKARKKLGIKTGLGTARTYKAIQQQAKELKKEIEQQAKKEDEQTQSDTYDGGRYIKDNGNLIDTYTGEVVISGGSAEAREAHYDIIIQGFESELMVYSGQLRTRLFTILDAHIKQFGKERVAEALEQIGSDVHDIIARNAKDSDGIAEEFSSVLADYLGLGNWERESLEEAYDT